VLDPIDGTKSFITGKPLFGTLIACLKNGVPIIGVIDQCVLDERWVGVVGEGTTLNGKPVKASGCEDIKESMMYATTPHMFGRGEEEDKFKTLCDTVKRPLYGADCYAYAIVASGFGADIVVEADLGLYDYCALVPVVEGAGGVMTDWRGRKLTLQNHEDCKGRVLACANAKLHQQALSILGKDWKKPIISASVSNVLLPMAVGICFGMALSRSRP
jgi:inositol-phosphate phosphatase/L-galactose 1-phosphate phosphatase/histidinol-phosphatase